MKLRGSSYLLLLFLVFVECPWLALCPVFYPNFEATVNPLYQWLHLYLAHAIWCLNLEYFNQYLHSFLIQTIMSTTDSKPKNSKPKNKKKRSNPVFSIVFSVIWGVITGVLWAYANPIQLVPGIIQWRIFAFLPPVIGILFGSISGFILGYLGSVVRGLLAGTFIPAHTLLVDGIMVGLTGLVLALFVGNKYTLEELATSKKALIDAVLYSGMITLG